MKISSSGMSEILRGSRHWKLTSKRAAAVVRALKLPPEQTNRLLEILDDPDPRVREPVPNSGHKLLTDWLYLAVLVSFDLTDKKLCQPESLSYRLAVPVTRVQTVIDDLIQEGYLGRSENGEVARIPRAWTAGDGPSSEVIRAHHRGVLQTAIRAVDEVPYKQRDFTSLTFAGNSRRMEEIRGEIRSLHERIQSLMEEDGTGLGNDEVFRLSICLFPMNFAQQEVPK